RRSEALALGAALRSGIVPPETELGDAPLRAARHTLGALRARIALAQAPEDWNLWLGDVIELDGISHGGTTGVADDEWYHELSTYAVRTGAPERVIASLTFLRSLRAWDW